MERTSRDGVELVLVEGELDIATASRLISILNSSVAEAIKAVVVDLTDVGFMDSTGLALLINANRRLALRRKGFAVVCPPGPLRRVFEITDMVDTLHVCPDQESATRALMPA
ncbi:MAG: anti-sigma factor antagonist [Thermoleophilaceae bacterium]|nr:anti-sigma factor antagonist [Thermoleophilaceae bacterium]